jgi:hypothetical protein
MRVLICGDRNYNNPDKIRRFVASLPKDTTVIQGECRGADTFAREAANEFGLIVASYPAHWNLYGNAAGPIRNKQMLDQGKPDLVAAFHDDLSRSKGTKNMIALAKSYKIPVVINPERLDEEE